MLPIQSLSPNSTYETISAAVVGVPMAGGSGIELLRTAVINGLSIARSETSSLEPFGSLDAPESWNAWESRLATARE